MRKTLFMCLLFLSLLLLLSACGGDDKSAAKNDGANKEDNTEKQSSEQEIGLNKITLDEMVSKKNNKESFFLFMFDAPQKNVKQTKLLEAYDKALQEKKVKAFYINIHDLSYEKEQQVTQLNNKYKENHRGHNPFEEGGMAVVHHGKIDSAFEYLGKRRFLGVAIEQKNKKNKTFFKDGSYQEIKKGIQHNLDFVKEMKINM